MLSKETKKDIKSAQVSNEYDRKDAILRFKEIYARNKLLYEQQEPMVYFLDNKHKTSYEPMRNTKPKVVAYKDFDDNPDLNIRIKNLDISAKLKRLFQYEWFDIDTVEDLIAYTEKEILALPKMGKNFLNELKVELSKLGLKFGMIDI